MGVNSFAASYAPGGLTQPSCEKIESELIRENYNRSGFQPAPIKCPVIPDSMRPVGFYMDINKNGWSGKKGPDGEYVKGRDQGQYADICFRINNQKEPLCFSAAVSTGIEKEIPVTIGGITKMVAKMPTPSQLGVYIGKIDPKYSSKSFGGSPMPYTDFFKFNFSGAPKGIAAHFRKGRKGRPASGGCIGLDWLEAETIHCMLQSMRDNGEDTAVVNIVDDSRELYWKNQAYAEAGKGPNEPLHERLRLTDVPWYRGCHLQEMHLAEDANRRKRRHYQPPESTGIAGFPNVFGDN